LGIKHEFNICLDNYEESHALMDICFDKGFKNYIEHPGPIGEVGINMIQGAFLGEF